MIANLWEILKIVWLVGLILVSVMILVGMLWSLIKSLSKSDDE